MGEIDMISDTKSDYKIWRDFLNTHNFWDIVEKIGWKDKCAKYRANGSKGEESPTVTCKPKVLELVGGDKFIKNRLREMALGYRKTLQNWIESYTQAKFGRAYGLPTDKNLSTGDDGWWDLCAHIVGCGREAYLKAINDPESIVTDYVENKSYVENFEYIL